jgi:hypothetical protein
MQVNITHHSCKNIGLGLTNIGDISMVFVTQNTPDLIGPNKCNDKTKVPEKDR